MVNKDTFSDFRGSTIPPWTRPWRKGDKQVNQLSKLIDRASILRNTTHVLRSEILLIQLSVLKSYRYRTSYHNFHLFLYES